ncbi:putative c6 zinc finger domain protein [Phaeomoniella chlamydospora]|uniref:Putative c6 zinc finger domain protein n=1 Tax=Phaeomoniella chlamydospora TaxID=158046 RepID=A0A0G2HGH8_PHACM|nr:putative c6 zinc finger domain protein [Phaeomoniella chlamydospora]
MVADFGNIHMIIVQNNTQHRFLKYFRLDQATRMQFCRQCNSGSLVSTTPSNTWETPRAFEKYLFYEGYGLENKAKLYEISQNSVANVGQSRIRKVKCDETRPDCYRCLSTGRRCDGYASKANQPRRVTDIAIPAPLQFLHEASDFEKRYFQKFLCSTGPSLSGPLDTEFWQRTIPQLCVAEPVIYDAVVAISALAQRPSRSDYPLVGQSEQPLTIDHDQKTALALYSRAMSRFASYTATNTHILGVAIITCILFVCIEMLEDSIERAGFLFQLGVKLLAQFEGDLHTTHNVNEMTVLIKSNVVPLFKRLSVAAVFIGIPTNIPLPTQHALGRPKLCFHNLTEARDMLYTLMANWYPVIQRAYKHKSLENLQIEVSQDLLEHQRNAISILHEWHAGFQAVMVNGVKSTLDEYTGSILLVHYHLSVISVSTACTPYETAYDHYDHSFREIVRQAPLVLSSDASAFLQVDSTDPATYSTSDPPIFKFDLGIVACLYFVAIRCRLSEVRRRALALLWKCPRKEGAWKALSTAKLSKLIIDLEEEAGVGPIYSLKQPSSIALTEMHHLDWERDLEAVTEESRRIHGIRMHQRYDSPTKWQIEYTTAQADDCGKWREIVHTHPIDPL